MKVEKGLEIKMFLKDCVFVSFLLPYLPILKEAYEAFYDSFKKEDFSFEKYGEMQKKKKIQFSRSQLPVTFLKNLLLALYLLFLFVHGCTSTIYTLI